MMKKLYTAAAASLLLAIGQPAFAQRYLTEVFTDAQITVTSNVVYGQNISIENTILAALSGINPPPMPDTVGLLMDVYQPSQTADTETDRPLIIYLPTGNFLPPVVNGAPTGSRTDSSAVNIAKMLAKRGFVVAVADYRRGWNPVSTSQVVRTGTILNAAYRGQQDSKTVVRYFRNDRATTNVYKIDGSRIVLFGEGTGGYVALAHAFLDAPWKISRLPGIGDDKFLRTQNPDSSVVDTNRVGNFDGTNDVPLNLMDFALSGGDLLKINGNVANYPSYVSEVSMVINMGGALGDTSWLDRGQIPMIGIHAVRDPNAPYQVNDVIVPTTGDVVIPFASGAGSNITRAAAWGNNDAFATVNYNDPITAAVTARYNQNIAFDGATINTGSGEGLLPFILPEVTPKRNNHGSPWQFWNSNQPTALATIPGSNPAVSTHLAGIQSNPFMAQSNEIGRNTALSYIDTVIRYISPRVVCALDLEECTILSTRDLNRTAATVAVFPNPAQSAVTLKSLSGESIRSYTLTDLSGRVVARNLNINETAVQITRGDLKAGMYLLNYETRTSQGTLQVVFE